MLFKKKYIFISFHLMRPLWRWIRSWRRNRLKFYLIVYFVLVILYKILEIILVNVDLFDTGPNHAEIGCKSSTHQTCNQSFAIDAVYTWVNGSDPLLLEALRRTTNKLIANRLKQFCYNSTECADSSIFCTFLPIVLIRPRLPDAHKYFGDAIKYENLNESASIIYLKSLKTAQSIGTNCVQVIDGQIYKLTNLYYIANSSRQAQALTINSLVRLDNISLVPHFAQKNPLKYFSSLTRKHFEYVNLDDTFENRNSSSALYSTRLGQENASKIVSFMRDKVNASVEYKFAVEYPLPVQMTDCHFFHHELHDENTRRNRFADNDELRYSLRSLERFAPWIRNVFIVTNGQMPHWLNVEHPKIRLIQHQDIFPNQTHLPSFSSASIESHLHRIPNLSKRFLYFNDDVILGRHIYPDDFYTQSKGFKVYLSWPVPNCAEGCPLTWLNDGYCDKACNSSKCLWDGGDCMLSDNSTSNSSTGNNSQVPLETISTQNIKLCASNCLTSWLGDSFCDQVCNKPECAYDMADCGVKNFASFEQISINHLNQTYFYQTNSSVIFLNFTNFARPLDEQYLLKLSSAQFENVTSVFSAVLNQKHRILTVLLYPQIERQMLNFTITASINQRTFNFSIFVQEANNTNREAIDNSPFNFAELLQKIEMQNSIPSKVVSSILNPRTLPEQSEATILSCDVQIDSLPVEIKDKFDKIEKQLNEGLVTDRGKEHFYKELKQLYSNLICNDTQKIHNNPIKDFIVNSLLEEDSERQVHRSRRLLDAYADSLIYVNHLFNKAFGMQSRQVPAHMAHFIDVDVMTRLQSRFSEYFQQTSARQVRSSEDMQFSFSYFYFLMSEIEECNANSILLEFDIDRSSTFSYNELKTLIIYLNELPLKLQHYQMFYQELNLCCEGCISWINETYHSLHHQTPEIDLSLETLQNCDKIKTKILTKCSKRNRNKFEIINDDDVAFKMLRSNESLLEEELNELRSKRKKFICLNDNFEHGINSTQEINLRRVLKEFYNSILPTRSQFEHPQGHYNRFLYIEPYHRWMHNLREKHGLYFNCSYLFLIINIILFIAMLTQ